MSTPARWPTAIRWQNFAAMLSFMRGANKLASVVEDKEDHQGYLNRTKVSRVPPKILDGLSQKDRRRFAAREASRLSHGGAECVAGVIGFPLTDAFKLRWRGKSRVASLRLLRWNSVPPGCVGSPPPFLRAGTIVRLPTARRQ